MPAPCIDPDSLFAQVAPPQGVSAPKASACLHCGAPLAEGSARDYCCIGCEWARAFLESRGLERYYDLRGGRGQPVADATRGDRTWLEPLAEQIRAAIGVVPIDADVQGIHCAACVWLIERWFSKQVGAVSASVNPALGRARFFVRRGFEIGVFAADLARLGYLLGPPRKSEDSASSDLLLRMGICIALAMNAMLFAIAMYAGLDEGPVRRLFERLELGLSTLAVLVGGPVFFRSAWRGLRRGLLHLDLPISAGIVLAYASSAWSFFAGPRLAVYFDTLTTFISLMLVGRFLQERLVAKNRASLLASDGADSLLVRRLRDGKLETVAARSVEAGHRLVLAPGEVCPVEGILVGAEARFSLDWICGETEARSFTAGDRVPAGAILAGERSQNLDAAQNFADSSLVELLRAPEATAERRDGRTEFWDSLARCYVAGVLAVAVLAVAAAVLRGCDPETTLGIVTSVLIVTCPCAFGLATPLAYEIVLGRLRREGLFVRSLGFLDRACSVRRVVFDKTGTLTTGLPELLDARALGALSAGERAILYNLAARSSHPKSAALVRALGPHELTADATLDVRHVVGCGLSARTGEGEYRLGARAWVVGVDARGEGDDIVFGCAGRVLCSVETAEALRPDARREVAALAEDGYEVWISSGDQPARVASLALACGVPAERALASQSPEDKAEFIHRRDRRDTLMVGDGINDSLAIADAWCSGTPAVDRPFLSAKSDFYFTTPGLRPIRLALEQSLALRRTVRMNLAWALTYNALAVALAVCGKVSPLVCAVVMPAFSLFTLAATTFSLSDARSTRASHRKDRLTPCPVG